MDFFPPDRDLIFGMMLCSSKCRISNTIESVAETVRNIAFPILCNPFERRVLNDLSSWSKFIDTNFRRCARFSGDVVSVARGVTADQFPASIPAVTSAVSVEAGSKSSRLSR